MFLFISNSVYSFNIWSIFCFTSVYLKKSAFLTLVGSGPKWFLTFLFPSLFSPFPSFLSIMVRGLPLSLFFFAFSPSSLSPSPSSFLLFFFPSEMSQKISHVDKLLHLAAETNDSLAVGHLFSLENIQTGNDVNKQVRAVIWSFVQSIHLSS